MNRLPLFLIAPVLALAACTGDEPGTDLVARATQEIRDEIASGNLSLGKGRNGEPHAELSPAGDLLIDGKPVELDAAQRERVLAYRGELAAVAEAGAAVGLQGAALAKDAVGSALKAVASGGSAEDVDREVKAQAGEIEASAKALCDRLPALYAAQQSLVESVPAFEPYAGMDESDVSECHVNL